MKAQEVSFLTNPILNSSILNLSEPKHAKANQQPIHPSRYLSWPALCTWKKTYQWHHYYQQRASFRDGGEEAALNEPPI
jgi:hypothetical protein